MYPKWKYLAERTLLLFFDNQFSFLNFHEDFRRTLTLVIRQEHYESFPAPAEKTYQDRVIAVRGKITLHRGAPQIEVTSPEQIEILE